jgi:hypothetical protein
MQSFLNFLRILNRLEVGVFDRAVKLELPFIRPLFLFKLNTAVRVRCHYKKCYIMKTFLDMVS